MMDETTNDFSVFNSTPPAPDALPELEEGECLVRPVWIQGVAPSRSGGTKAKVAFKFMDEEGQHATWKSYNLDHPISIASWKRDVLAMGGETPVLVPGDVDENGHFTQVGASKVESVMQEIVNRRPLMRARAWHKRGKKTDENTGEVHVFTQISLLERVDNDAAGG